jgi:hypothetical protein
MKKQNDGSFSLYLNDDRRVTISKFKNQTLISIRQYYKNDSGESLPTKKGIL